MILTGWDSHSPQKQNKAQICFRNKVPKQKNEGLFEKVSALTNATNFVRIKKQQIPAIRTRKLTSTIQSKKSSVQKVICKEKHRNFDQQAKIQPLRQQVKIQPLRQWTYQNISLRASSNIERLKKQAEFFQQQSKLQSPRLKTSQDSQPRSAITQPSPLLFFLNQKKISSLKNPRRIKKGRPQIAISGKKSIVSIYKKQSNSVKSNAKSKRKSKIMLTQLKQNNKGGLISQMLSKWNTIEQTEKNKYRNLMNNPTIVLRYSLATIS